MPESTKSTYLDLLKRVLTGYVFPESSDYVWRPQPGWRPKDMIETAGAKFFARWKTRLVKSIPFNAADRQLGKDWPSIAYTMVGLKRLDNVQHAIETVLRENIPGDLCECGVWRGGVAIFMRAALEEYQDQGRVVWLADSFAGIPKGDGKKYPADDGIDMTGIDYLAVPLTKVQANFRAFDLLDDRVRFLEGWFRDTLPNAPIKRLAILRADGDLYESTMDILTNLYDKVSSGGFVIIDDYYSWVPCKKAVTDFRQSRGITSEIMPIDWTGAYWRVS